MSDGYRSVELQSDDTQMVCWVDDDPRLKVGIVLTLREIPDVRWTVTAVYNRQAEHQRRTWRVGGVYDR